jgi:putative membrane protein
MRNTVAGLLCCAAFSVMAMAQAGSTPAAAGKEAAGGDQEFLNFAAQTDMTEAHLGQMAQEQGSSQAVKDLGQMLATDHTNDYKQLGMLATKAGLMIPKGIDSKHDKVIAPFGKLKGKAFDRHYTHEMVAGHTAAIAQYKKEAANGQNADLKAYANETLATLEKHKTAAQDAEKAKETK